MRSFGKRLGRKFVDRRVKYRTETRDAVIWDIDQQSYIARVRIQGSAELVYAHYPRNWKKIPYWLKPGNAVEIRHREGVRGYIELVGEGRAIPTPISGEAFPVVSGLPDGVISGLEVSETTPETATANISSGWYRIEGVEYYQVSGEGSFIVMDDPAPMVMGDDYLMGMGSSTVNFTTTQTTASGEWRYDLIVLGADGVFDIVLGTQSDEPEVPATPGNHIIIGEPILWDWNDTVFDITMMGEVWQPRRATTMLTSLRSKSPSSITGEMFFEWLDSGEAGYPISECYIDCYVQCQYGMNLWPGSGSYTFIAERHETYGTGQLYSPDSGWMGEPPYYVTETASTYAVTFTYRRNQSVQEYMPSISVYLQSKPSVKSGVMIVLLDSDGIPIGGYPG